MQALFARTEDRCGVFLSRLETLLTAIGVRVAELEQRLDDAARQHEEQPARITTDAITRISILEQAVAERAEAAEVEMANRCRRRTRRRTATARGRRDSRWAGRSAGGCGPEEHRQPRSRQGGG